MSTYQILHAIGLVLGFGGAVISCFLMLGLKTNDKQLKRGKIARKICLATWTGLILLIISGVFLTIDYQKGHTSLMIVKHFLVAIILVDALIIHFRLFPRYFKQIGTPDFRKTYLTMRNIGMLSMSCWITIMILSGLLGR